MKQFILHNSGSEADASDVFQEAIIAAWINIREEKFVSQNGTTVEAYIFQIAKNKWLDIVRSKTFKSTTRLTVYSLAGANFTEEDTSEISTESRYKYLSELYTSLGEKCKRLLNLFYYQKRSLKEIGESLNMDPDTVRTTKYRCMMKLRKKHEENTNLKKAE